MNKITLNEFQERIDEKFGTNLYTAVEYNGDKGIAKLRCNTCNDIIQMQNGGRILHSPYQNYICRECDTIRRQKKSFQSKLQQLNISDFTFLEDYKGVGIPISIQHNTCSNQYYVDPDRFISNYSTRGISTCKACSTNHKPTTNEFSDTIYERSNGRLTVISEYENAKSNVSVRCNDCTHVFFIMADNLKRRLSCPNCNSTQGSYKRKSLKLIVKEFQSTNRHHDNYKINANFDIHELCPKGAKITVTHKTCNHSKAISPYKLKNYQCHYCKERIRQMVGKKEFIEQVELLGEGNYSVLSGEYKNNQSEFTLLHHECGHEFTTTPNRFKSAGARCPHCALSKGEEWIEKALIEFGLSYQHSVFDHDCIHKQPLEFDFIIPATESTPEWRIEYDGRQHFDKSFQRDPEVAKKELETIIKRDNIKNTYCFEKGIPLLRIPYTQKSYLHVKDLIEFYIKYDGIIGRVFRFYEGFSPSNYTQNVLKLSEGTRYV